MSPRSIGIKRLLLLTAGHSDHPSTRIRATQFIPDFNKENFEVKWIPRVPPEPKNTLSRFLFPVKKRILYLKTRAYLLFMKWDVVFVQRAYLEKYYLQTLKNRNIPLIFDFDDALYLHKNDLKKGKSLTGQMIEYSSAVIVSTDYLSPFCRKYNCEPKVIPTSVNSDLVKPVINKPTNTLPIVGWIGSSTTTITIKEAEEGLRRLAKKMDYKFLMVGADPGYKPEGVPYEHQTWTEEKEPGFLEKMDIGIMPLPLTKYSEGKGGFKLYLYMAAGIPSIATPIGVNSEVIIPGTNGYHATNDEEWLGYMYLLLNDAKLREEMGKRGRLIFEEKYSSRLAFQNLLAIIKKLLNNENQGTNTK